ncbi:hypothetical protein FHR69_003588 [Pseudomonas umsongensis]|uniref:Uncharacterized protein n=1 Tax=Pseudomonas umsongensis TaxID=198618 RepID=A0ACC5MG23_9PSED|nr:hypothetical protein [Pseudomonas umsongensis]
MKGYLVDFFPATFESFDTNHIREVGT